MALYARSADQSWNDAWIFTQSLTETIIQHIVGFEREETSTSLLPRHISRLRHALEILYVAIPCHIEQVPSTMQPIVSVDGCCLEDLHLLLLGAFLTVC